MIDKKFYSLSSFINGLESVHLLHNIRDFESAIEALIFSFNEEFKTILDNKEKRHLILQYAEFGDRLFAAEDLFVKYKSIEGIEDTEMKKLFEYISLLCCKMNTTINANKVKNNVIQYGFLKKKRRMFQEATFDLFNSITLIENIDDDFLNSDDFVDIFDEYKRCLSGLINVNIELGYTSLNTDAFLKNEYINLSREVEVYPFNQKTKDFEKLLFNNSHRFKQKQTEEQTKKILKNIFSNESLTQTDKLIKSKKNDIHDLINFSNNNKIYKF